MCGQVKVVVKIESEEDLLVLQGVIHITIYSGRTQIAPSMCKIVSPLSLSLPTGVVLKKENRDFKFTTKVQPLRLPSKNNKNKVNFYMRGRHHTFRDFEKMGNKVFARKYSVTGCLSAKYVEREFWREMAGGKKGTVEYGADLDTTAFSCDPNDLLGRSKWNLKTLPGLPNTVLRWLEGDIPGVTDPMLYIGMLFSMFAWHVEDHYLYSMSYLHCGAPKTWYGVPSEAAVDFEKVVQSHIYDNNILSSDGKVGALRVLLERTTMFPPNVLMQQGVPVYKAVQLLGEFVINFPRSYHLGFNQGFNCSEAVNFAFGDWFPFGAEPTKNYALFSKAPVVPYKELLCKEAMFLRRSANRNDNFHKDPLSGHCVKFSFATLMRMYQCARMSLKKSGATILVFSMGLSPISAYTSKCAVLVRKDMQEMESVAKKFEQEEGIREAIKERIKRESDMWTQNINDYENADILDSFDSEEKCNKRRINVVEKERARSAQRKNGDF